MGLNEDEVELLVVWSGGLCRLIGLVLSLTVLVSLFLSMFQHKWIQFVLMQLSFLYLFSMAISIWSKMMMLKYKDNDEDDIESTEDGIDEVSVTIPRQESIRQRTYKKTRRE